MIWLLNCDLLIQTKKSLKYASCCHLACLKQWGNIFHKNKVSLLFLKLWRGRNAFASACYLFFYIRRNPSWIQSNSVVWNSRERRWFFLLRQHCKLFNVLMSILVFSSCIWKLMIVNHLWWSCCIIKWAALSSQLLQHLQFLIIFPLKHPYIEASEEQVYSQALFREKVKIPCL